MTYNRKMRKFEGTCYIPGEQLAMMAKYYRGANLNLNLTLFEEDFATMQEILDQACWCSKLDELDRMKMSHMKGNEWRIQHEHCLEEAQQGSGRNPKVFPALPQNARSEVSKVERGTSAVSLYDRERGMVRGGRYQRDYYSEPRNRKDDHYNRLNRRDERNYPRDQRGNYSDPRDGREDYDFGYRRDDYPSHPTYHAQVLPNGKRADRNMGGPPDRRYDMESEAAVSSVPEASGEIRCAVCNVETCLICKNHVYSSMCPCKCAVANAGLCNKCSPEPCEEEEQVVQETCGNKMDMPSMMLAMMMSSMFKQSQAPDSVCCCRPSRDHSDSSSSDSSDGRVHKVYLYDCQDPKKIRKPKNKSKKANSDSSSGCDCCKCSRKPRKTEEGPKSGGKESSESDAGHKRPPKGKGNKSSDRKSKRGDSDSDADIKPKGSEEIIRKSTTESHKSNKSSKDDVKMNKSENMKTMKMMNEHNITERTKNNKTRESKAQGSIDSRNVKFSNTKKISPVKNQGLSSSESYSPKRSKSPQKPPSTFAPGSQISELLNTQQNDPNNKDGDTDGIGEESSTTFSLREFIVCLPKIQSNLQSLMYKLNQMDLMNNQLQYPRIDPPMANAQFCMGATQTRQDVPLLSPPQNPQYPTLGSSNNERPQRYTNYPDADSEVSIGYSPDSLQVQNLPPAISPGSSKDEPKSPKHLSPPTGPHSTVNFPNLGKSPNPMTIAPGVKTQVPETTNPTSTFKFSPVQEGGVQTTNFVRDSENQWSFNERNPLVNSPPLIFSNIDQNTSQHYFESELTTNQMHQKKLQEKILHYQKVHANGLQPQSNIFSEGGSPNVEIIELPETKCHIQGSNLSRKSSQMANKGTTLTASQNDADTIFQSYRRESSTVSSNQELTDYASFTDEKNVQLSPATSTQQAAYKTNNQIKATSNVTKSNGDAYVSKKQNNQNHSVISKSSQNNCKERALHKTRSTFKKSQGVAFKAKQRTPLSWDKLLQGCTPKGSGGIGIKNDFIKAETLDPSEMPKIKLLDQAVGPGKFRQSQSDSSLELQVRNPQRNSYTASSSRPKTIPKMPCAKNKTKTVPVKLTGKGHTVNPLTKKRSTSPIKEDDIYTTARKRPTSPIKEDARYTIAHKRPTSPIKEDARYTIAHKRPTSPIKEDARYTIAHKRPTLQPKRKESLLLGKFGFKNIPPNPTTDSDSIFKLSDAYVKQELVSPSYILSSVEVKTINNNGSSTDLLQMVQGIASSSCMNVTNVSSVPHQILPYSSDGLDIIPLLPLSSTTPSEGPESKNENQSGTALQKQDPNVSLSTPAFLRKSKVQVEQLKRAHETIRSMIKNVNDVIAHIDSDSKIGIKSKIRNEDQERQSYFVHLGDDGLKRQGRKPLVRQNEPNHPENHIKPGSSTEPGYSSDGQNRDVREMFLSVNRVINSVITPSEQSNSTQETGWSLDRTTPIRARKDFFVLNSETSSTAFTESLRRSLENDRSRSVPLVPQQSTQRDPRVTRPLKRRSWFPRHKK